MLESSPAHNYVMRGRRCVWLLACLGRRSTKDARRIEAHRLSHRLLCNLATWQPGNLADLTSLGHAHEGPDLASSTLRRRVTLLTRHQPLAVVIVLRTK